MDSGQYLVLLLMLGAGALFIVLGRMAARGRLRPNMFVGIRTDRTLASEEEWYRVHARAARPWTVAGVLLVVLNAAVLAAAAFGRLGQLAWGFSIAADVFILLVAAIMPLWGESEGPRQGGPEQERLERNALAALLGFLAFVLAVGAVFGYLLGSGSIGPNGAVGVRVPETLAGPEAWYRVNRPAGWAFLVSSLAGALACVWGAFALPRARRPGRVLAVSLAVVLLSFAALVVYTALLLSALGGA
ncbi:SdpI family protein [Oceanithermus sp.]|uniref:SdpI family protein n=1 Tax=Oceanithermus sp. TaxID=2268145 RepID=UPI00257C2BE1|nr:SdpI family protein [Oceanithermus sp.]